MTYLKKTTIIAALLALGSAGSATATDGTIRFTGVISASSCTVSSIADSASTVGTVNFGTVNVTSFDVTGKSTISTPFEIALTDCALTEEPLITFNGPAATVPSFTHLFTTDIDGIGIRISDAVTSLSYIPGVPAKNDNLRTLLSPGVTSAKARFNAYLVSYDNALPVAGGIDTNITFTITYA